MIRSLLSLDALAMAVLLVRVTIALTLFVCACLLVQRVVERSSAAVRHALWVSSQALGVMLLVALLLPLRWGSARADGEAGLLSVSLVATSTDQTTAQVGAQAGAQAAGQPESPALLVLERSTAQRVAAVLVGLWLAGLAVQLLQLVVSARRLRVVVRGARPLDPRLLPETGASTRRTVSLLGSDLVHLPLAAGILRPVIVLPATAATTWSQRRLRAALLHELAHIERGDVMWQLLARFCCALHWFNPLVWLAARQAAREAERACDDAVLRAGVRPSSYAGHLLEIARAARQPRNYATAVGQGSELEGRISAVLAPLRARRGLTRAALLVIVLLATVASAGFATHRRTLDERFALAPNASSTRPHEGQLASALVPMLRDADPEVRAAAAHSSGELRVRAAVPQLIDALTDEDASVRARAAHSLGELEDPVAIASLQQLLLTDASGAVRREAASALGEMDTEEAAAALRSALEQVNDRGLRRSVIRALGETGSPSGIAQLEHWIGRDGEATTRAALEALQQIGSPPATAALLRAMRSDNALVRRLAARAIAGDN